LFNCKPLKHTFNFFVYNLIVFKQKSHETKIIDKTNNNSPIIVTSDTKAKQIYHKIKNNENKQLRDELLACEFEMLSFVFK
jgi:hypothetical protein